MSRFKQFRENLGYTQAEMAAHIGIHQAAISQYERGLRTPDLLAFAKMVKNIPASPKFLLEIFVPEVFVPEV